MHGNTLLKHLFSARGGAIAAAAQEASVSEPGYLTRREANAIVAELVERDREGQLIPPVVAHPACPQRIYVALATVFPEEQRVISCAGLCYVQLLDDQGRVRVAALPSHLESASHRKVHTFSLREEQLHQMLPWDRTLQRLETCCVRDVLQVYVSHISGIAVPAHPYALDADGLPVQTLAPVGQREQAGLVPAPGVSQNYVAGMGVLTMHEMKTPLKTLAELHLEVELGLTVYAHPQRAFVMRDTDTDGLTWYVFWSYWGEREQPLEHVDPDGTIICNVFHPECDSWGVGELIPMDDCHASFDALLAKRPEIAALSIWDTLAGQWGEQIPV